MKFILLLMLTLMFPCFTSNAEESFAVVVKGNIYNTTDAVEVIDLGTSSVPCYGYLFDDGTLVVNGESTATYSNPETTPNSGGYYPSPLGKTEKVKCIYFTDKVKEIGNSLICNSSIEEIIFSEGLVRIGNYAFFQSNSLKVMPDFPSTLRIIGNYAFKYSINTKGSIILPDGFQTLGNSSFQYCQNLDGTIRIPESLTHIPQHCFNECKRMTKIEWHDNIVGIGRKAFEECRSLRGTWPSFKNLRNLGWHAFTACFYIEGDLVFGENLNFQSIDEDPRYFSSCKGIKSITFHPNAPSIIPSGTFAGVGDLEFVKLPTECNLTLYDGCFTGCRIKSDFNLDAMSRKITLVHARRIVHADELCFTGDYGLTWEIHKNEHEKGRDCVQPPNRKVYMGPFSYSEFHGDVTLKGNIDYRYATVDGGVYYNTFNTCVFYEDVIIGEGAKLNPMTFYDCDFYKPVQVLSSNPYPADLPSNLEYCYPFIFVDGNFFCGEQFTEDSTLDKIPDYCFYYVDFEDGFNMLNSMTAIGDYGAYYCRFARECNISPNTTSIGYYAFSYSVFACDLIIPESVVTVGPKAFNEIELWDYDPEETKTPAPYTLRLPSKMKSPDGIETGLGYILIDGDVIIDCEEFDTFWNTMYTEFDVTGDIVINSPELTVTSRNPICTDFNSLIFNGTKVKMDADMSTPTVSYNRDFDEDGVDLASEVTFKNNSIEANIIFNNATFEVVGESLNNVTIKGDLVFNDCTGGTNGVFDSIIVEGKLEVNNSIVEFLGNINVDGDVLVTDNSTITSEHPIMFNSTNLSIIGENITLGKDVFSSNRVNTLKVECSGNIGEGACSEITATDANIVLGVNNDCYVDDWAFGSFECFDYDLVLGDSITYIGEGSFMNWQAPDVGKFETLTIPEKCTVVDMQAFCCSPIFKNLNIINTEGDLLIEAEAFDNVGFGGELIIPRGTTVESSAFKSNEFTSICISEDVPYVSDTAFIDNSVCERLEIHSQLPNIGDSLQFATMPITYMDLRGCIPDAYSDMVVASPVHKMYLYTDDEDNAKVYDWVQNNVYVNWATPKYLEVVAANKIVTEGSVVPMSNFTVNAVRNKYDVNNYESDGEPIEVLSELVTEDMGLTMSHEPFSATSDNTVTFECPLPESVNSSDTIIYIEPDTKYPTIGTIQMEYVDCIHPSSHDVPRGGGDCITKDIIDIHCADCNAKLGEKDGELGDHVFGEGVITVAATCTEEGRQDAVCTLCGFEDNIPTTKVSHQFTRDTVVKEPTCLEDGTRLFSCSMCGLEDATEPIEKLGHDYKMSINEPTCVDKGKEVHTCSRCSETYFVAIKELGHDYKSVVTAPTCTVKGHTDYTCSRCSNSYSDSRPALGHVYSSQHIPATFKERGYTKYTCIRLDHEYTVLDPPVSAVVDGFVLEDNGQPCDDRLVVLNQDTSKEVNYTFTDYSGYFELKDVSQGKHSVAVYAQTSEDIGGEYDGNNSELTLMSRVNYDVGMNGDVANVKVSESSDGVVVEEKVNANTLNIKVKEPAPKITVTSVAPPVTVPVVKEEKLPVETLYLPYYMPGSTVPQMLPAVLPQTG